MIRLEDCFDSYFIMKIVWIDQPNSYQSVLSWLIIYFSLFNINNKTSVMDTASLHFISDITSQMALKPYNDKKVE